MRKRLLFVSTCLGALVLRGNGGKFVNGNMVRENVQCTENELPFVGGPNTASKSEGQCF